MNLLTFTICIAQGLELEELASGFDKPVDIAHAGDDRLFIVEKDGIIQIIDADTVVSEPFLDIDSQVNSSANERGLLGLVFHPNYTQNGYFFVHYNNLNGTTTISRFTVSSDPNIADKSSEKIILTIPQPYNNHNGGDLNFGPDGYLYIGMGDGGSGGDPEDRAQNRQSLLGKMLRIDIDNGDPYSIPEDNPFAMDDFTLDEIWAIGMRNPWRFSFDRLTGDMYIADVGQNNWEEIDFEPAGDPGGRNYGWRCYEGFEDFNLFDCPDMSEMIFPIHVYFNNPFNDGCSVTGGYVYRGQNLPGIYGKYIYADFCSGKIWSLERDECDLWHNDLLFDGPPQEYSSFGEDVSGEIYVAALGSGVIYRITSNCSITISESITPESCTGDDGSINLDISGAVEPVFVEWSSGAEGPVLNDLSTGEYSYTITDGSSCKAFGCVFVDSESQLPVCSFGMDEMTVCVGEVGQIQLSSGCTAPLDYFYIWYQDGEEIADENGPDLSVSENGMYAVQISNGSCSNPISDPIDISFISSGPGPEISWNTTLDTAFVVTDTFVSYIWIIDGEEILDENGAFVPINGSSGPIIVFGIDEFGCMSTQGGPFFIENTDELTWIKEFDVFPNPFHDQCTLKLVLKKPVDIELQVMGSDGKIIFDKSCEHTENLEKIIDLSDASPGIYLVIIKTEKGIISKKIFKN